MAELLELGRVIGAFGIRGWIRVESFTQPPEQILRYRRWNLGGREWKVNGGQLHSGSVVAELDGLVNREIAAALRHEVIGVAREALPKSRKGEFYWADAIGSAVVNAAGTPLGTLAGLTSNGVQDVMVVVDGEHERLIPAVSEAILIGVDVEAKRIVVDWQPEW